MDKISQLGYSFLSPYRDNPYLDIHTPEGLIDMSNTDIPLYAQDETGYGKLLQPFSGMHKFRGKKVREYRMQNGGSLSNTGTYSAAAPVYKTQAEVNAANNFAKDFSRRHNTLFANESWVADKPGDPVVQFRTLDGKPYIPQQMPASMIQHSVPDDVTSLLWDHSWNMPYYLDGEDMVFVDKKFYNNGRFYKPPILDANGNIARKRLGGRMQAGGSYFYPNPAIRTGDLQSNFGIHPLNDRNVQFEQQAQTENNQENQRKLLKAGFGKDAARYESTRPVNKRSKEANDAIQQVTNDEYRVRMHPDFDPNKTVDSQLYLNNDNSLRTMILRGRNYVMNDKGSSPLVRFVTKNIAQPASSFANLTMDPYNQYIKPGWKEGLFNFGKDAFTTASALMPEHLAGLGSNTLEEIRKLGVDLLDPTGNALDYSGKLGLGKIPSLAEFAMEKYKKGGKMQIGGTMNPFASEVLGYLMDDDVQDTAPKQQTPTAPTTDEVEEPKQQDDQDNGLAMEIAMGDFIKGKGNPYSTSSSFNTAKLGVNPYVTKSREDILGLGATDLGIWGDEAHQQRRSDHNTGDAEDFGFSSPDMASTIVSKLQNEATKRNVKYIIYNGRIWNPSISPDWRPYNGPDPHKTHIHVSYNR